MNLDKMKKVELIQQVVELQGINNTLLKQRDDNKKDYDELKKEFDSYVETTQELKNSTNKLQEEAEKYLKESKTTNTLLKQLAEEKQGLQRDVAKWKKTAIITIIGVIFFVLCGIELMFNL